MEFNFDINRYFKNEITKVGSRLIPDGFLGDRREHQECGTRISLVLTVLGENSAKAQGLQKVITSGDRLRNSDHIVYILTDPKGGPKGAGCVLGMLKMGCKHLYVFDAGGNNHEVSARCVLDFYIHESKQRMGLGRRLFQHMLKEENIEPQHLAIDKPSPKFLSFLHKHYGLETIIPQMNNFVVFDGFFTNRQSRDWIDSREKIHPAGVSSLASRYSSGSFTSFTPTFVATSPSPQQQLQTVYSPSLNYSTHSGRPAPHKPVSTMGMILQQKPSAQQPTQPGRYGDILPVVYQL